MTGARADDGYRLWLRYEPIADAKLRATDAALITEIAMPADSPTLAAARDELVTGLNGLLGAERDLRARLLSPLAPNSPHGQPARSESALHLLVVNRSERDGALVVGTPEGNPEIAQLGLTGLLRKAGDEGYVLHSYLANGQHRLAIAANRDVGILYGAFALLRLIQEGRSLATLNIVSQPKIQRRMLNHWDNLNGKIERGYAGRSLWDWAALPGQVSPRYRDYARADASLGLNGTVLNNVNADPQILTAPYLHKVAALAAVFRTYGIRVYLSARFSAPVEIGGLTTADPLDPSVIQWWRAKADEIYRAIPDFGGFLVKANSEGQPGPQTYGRSHADGANLLAGALAPHGGIVIWRAFVYSEKAPEDRIKQAYSEFKPLDGKFLPNCLVQVKNGPFDFQVREPFHPLFGAMPRTNLMLELQITQEYLGQSKHLVFLAPLYRECLQSDTFGRGAGSTVAKVIDGSLDRHSLTGIAGVANTGDDRDWCGHPFSAANWYAFGRLAWDPDLTAEQIADEWIRASFGSDAHVAAVLKPMMIESRETEVKMTMPLGLAGLFQEGSHYGPEPWFDRGRADWTAVYYHRADARGLGFDRTASGSNAAAQYYSPVRERFASLGSCPDKFLLWFHHVPWDYRMRSGRSLWDELCFQYQSGVDEVRRMESSWNGLREKIDPERFGAVAGLLRIQERDARWWRDACLLYFQQFSRRPLPKGVEQPALTLAQYEAISSHGVP